MLAGLSGSTDIPSEDGVTQWTILSFKIFTYVGKTAELRWVPLPQQPLPGGPCTPSRPLTEGKGQPGLLPSPQPEVQAGSWAASH